MMWLLALLSKFPFFIGHISNKNSFPRPLSKTDEKLYIQKCIQGDLTARDKLIEHNMRLVAHIAKKYTSSGRDSDDLISSPEKSTHLATYASRCIENEILMHLRATKRQRGEISLQEPIGTDKEGNEVSLIDILRSGELEISDNVETKMQIRELLEKMERILGKREQRVLILRFGLGGKEPLTQREVAKILNISRSYVSRIEKSAIEKLKS